QKDAAGNLTASLASLIRYAQNQGLLGSPNGPASPDSLSQFLNANSGYAPEANPWVALQFAGVAGGVAVESTGLDIVRERVNTGTPVLLDFDIQPDGMASVVAIGVNADGSIAVVDPNPASGRTVLDASLAGKIRSALTIAPSLVAPAGFVVAAPVSAAV